MTAAAKRHLARIHTPRSVIGPHCWLCNGNHWSREPHQYAKPKPASKKAKKKAKTAHIRRSAT